GRRHQLPPTAGQPRGQPPALGLHVEPRRRDEDRGLLPPRRVRRARRGLRHVPRPVGRARGRGRRRRRAGAPGAVRRSRRAIHRKARRRHGRNAPGGRTPERGTYPRLTAGCSLAADRAIPARRRKNNNTSPAVSSMCPSPATPARAGEEAPAPRTAIVPLTSIIAPVSATP